MTMPKDPILDAAVRMFMLYGVTKATMGDLAREAEVSRQTLYSRFEGKEGVILAATRYVTEQAVLAAREGIAGATSLAERLDIYFDRITVAFFDMVHQSPGAQELLLGVNRAAKAASQEAEARKAEVLAEVLAPYEAALARHGQSAAEVAAFAVSSASALKYVARDKAELEARLGTLKRMILTLAGE